MYVPLGRMAFAFGQRQVTVTDRRKQSVIGLSQSVFIADKARK
jgi:hypothetical protein